MSTPEILELKEQFTALACVPHLCEAPMCPPVPDYATECSILDVASIINNRELCTGCTNAYWDGTQCNFCAFIDAEFENITQSACCKCGFTTGVCAPTDCPINYYNGSVSEFPDCENKCIPCRDYDWPVPTTPAAEFQCTGDFGLNDTDHCPPGFFEDIDNEGTCASCGGNPTFLTQRERLKCNASSACPEPTLPPNVTECTADCGELDTIIMQAMVQESILEDELDALMVVLGLCAPNCQQFYIEVEEHIAGLNRWRDWLYGFLMPYQERYCVWVSAAPTASPTGDTTASPTSSPTALPTNSPTGSAAPTSSPTALPTSSPTEFLPCGPLRACDGFEFESFPYSPADFIYNGTFTGCNVGNMSLEQQETVDNSTGGACFAALCDYDFPGPWHETQCNASNVSAVYPDIVLECPFCMQPLLVEYRDCLDNNTCPTGQVHFGIRGLDYDAICANSSMMNPLDLIPLTITATLGGVLEVPYDLNQGLNLTWDDACEFSRRRSPLQTPHIPRSTNLAIQHRAARTRIVTRSHPGCFPGIPVLETVIHDQCLFHGVHAMDVHTLFATTPDAHSALLAAYAGSVSASDFETALEGLATCWPVPGTAAPPEELQNGGNSTIILIVIASILGCCCCFCVLGFFYNRRRKEREFARRRKARLGRYIEMEEKLHQQ